MCSNIMYLEDVIQCCVFTVTTAMFREKVLLWIQMHYLMVWSSSLSLTSIILG